MPHLPGPRALVPEDTQLLGEKIAWRPDWCSHPIAPGNRHSAVRSPGEQESTHTLPGLPSAGVQDLSQYGGPSKHLKGSFSPSTVLLQTLPSDF